MRRTFKIIDGDISFDKTGNIEMVEGEEAEKQALERLFTTNVGEWFLNAVHGLEYGEIQGKDITDEQIRLAFMKAVAQEPSVEEIEDINIERNNQKRTVRITVRCRMKRGNVVEVVRDIG